MIAARTTKENSHQILLVPQLSSCLDTQHLEIIWNLFASGLKTDDANNGSFCSHKSLLEASVYLLNSPLNIAQLLKRSLNYLQIKQPYMQNPTEVSLINIRQYIQSGLSLCPTAVIPGTFIMISQVEKQPVIGILNQRSLYCGKNNLGYIFLYETGAVF